MAALRPDIALSHRFLAKNPPPGRVLVCAITGSHQYGFASPDSDIDLKGIHLAPTAEYLGLSTPVESFDRLEIFEGMECDLTTNEAKQALSLLLRGNGNMLERLFSPFQLVESEELRELRELAKGALSRRFFGHYAGFFQGVCREHDKSGAPTAKSMLYSYRVALTGLHLLLRGELEANLGQLSKEHGYPEVEELMRKKQEAKEKLLLSPEENERWRASWPSLLTRLEEARDQSPLPPEPKNREAVSSWLVSLRQRER